MLTIANKNIFLGKGINSKRIRPILKSYSSQKTNKKNDYDKYVEYVQQKFNVNMHDTSDINVRILWCDFEELQSKTYHKHINSSIERNINGDRDQNSIDPLEDRIYDV